MQSLRSATHGLCSWAHFVSILRLLVLNTQASEGAARTWANPLLQTPANSQHHSPLTAARCRSFAFSWRGRPVPPGLHRNLPLAVLSQQTLLPWRTTWTRLHWHRLLWPLSSPTSHLLAHVQTWS